MRNIRRGVRPVSRYGRAMEIPDNFVNARRRGRWRILSSRGEKIYKVRRLLYECVHRGCVSTEQELCMHKYHCSCDDVVNPCKHIYIIHSMEEGRIEIEVRAHVREELYSLAERLWQVIGNKRLTMRLAGEIRRNLQQLLLQRV